MACCANLMGDSSAHSKCRDSKNCQKNPMEFRNESNPPFGKNLELPQLDEATLNNYTLQKFHKQLESPERLIGVVFSFFHMIFHWADITSSGCFPSSLRVTHNLQRGHLRGKGTLTTERGRSRCWVLWVWWLVRILKDAGTRMAGITGWISCYVTCVCVCVWRYKLIL